MRLTTLHLRFYQEKKTPLPSWWQQIAQPPACKVVRTVSVHELINGQTPKPRIPYAASNLCSLLTRVIRSNRRDLLQYLDQISWSRETHIDGNRRRAFARKWAARIRKERP